MSRAAPRNAQATSAATPQTATTPQDTVMVTIICGTNIPDHEYYATKIPLALMEIHSAWFTAERRKEMTKSVLLASPDPVLHLADTSSRAWGMTWMWMKNVNSKPDAYISILDMLVLNKKLQGPKDLHDQCVRLIYKKAAADCQFTAADIDHLLNVTQPDCAIRRLFRDIAVWKLRANNMKRVAGTWDKDFVLEVSAELSKKGSGVEPVLTSYKDY